MANNGNYSVRIQAIDGFSNVIKSFNNQMRLSQAPVRRLQGQLNQFNNLSGIRHVANNFTELTGRIRNTTDSAVNLLKQLTAISAIGSAAGAAAALQQAGAQANTARITGNQMGISGAQVLRQQSASRILGVDENTITNSYSGTQNMQREVANGQNADAQQIMASMGYTPEQAARLNPNDVIKQFMAHAQQELHNGMDAATVRGQFQSMHIDTSLMGIDPSKLSQAQEAAANLSKVTEQGTQNLEQMNLASRRLQEGIRGFGVDIAQKVSPAVTNLINEFTTWITTSPEVKNVTDQITNGIVGLCNWLSNLPFAKIYNDLRPILPSFSTLTKIIGGLIALKVAGWISGILMPFARLGFSVIRTGFIISSFAVSAAGSLIKTGANAMMMAFNFVRSGGIVRGAAAVIRGACTLMRVAFTTATGPIGIAIAAIALAAYEIYKHWNVVGPYFQKIWGVITKAFNSAVTALSPIAKSIGSLFSGMWDGIRSVFDAGWKYVGPIFDKMQAAIGWAVNHIPGLSSIVSGAHTAFNAAKNVYNDVTGTVPSGTNDTAENANSGDGAVSSNPQRPATFLPSPAAMNTSGSGYQTAPAAVARLEQLGLPHAAAVGVAANILKESNFNAQAKGDNGAAFGIGQWHKDRQDAISKHFGKDIHSMTRDEQLQAYIWDMSTANGGHTLQRLQGITSSANAAAMVSRYNERPANQQGEMADRARIATNIDNILGGKRNPADMMQQPYSMPQADIQVASNDTGGQMNGNISVTVGFDENSKVIVKTKADNGMTVNNPMIVSKRPVMSHQLV